MKFAACCRWAKALRPAAACDTEFLSWEGGVRAYRVYRVIIGFIGLNYRVVGIEGFGVSSFWVLRLRSGLWLSTLFEA